MNQENCLNCGKPLKYEKCIGRPYMLAYCPNCDEE